MIRRIADLLSKLLKHRDIWKNIDGVETLYLRRFYLTPRKWSTRLFLHFIFRSDDDRHCHDHPWDFSSFILWNGYKEHTWWSNHYDSHPPKYYGMFTFRKMKAEHIHKVELDSIKPAITLVFAKKARRNWGFWSNEHGNDKTVSKWIDWRTYLGLQNTKDHLEDVID